MACTEYVEKAPQKDNYQDTEDFEGCFQALSKTILCALAFQSEGFIP